MSTLTVTDITDSTNSIGTSTVTKATPKTTCSYVGTSTVYIKDSINISGLTDYGTGDYILSYTSNYTANTYPLIGNSVHQTVASYPGLACYYNCGSDTTRSTTACRQKVFQTFAVDSPLLNLIISGTLA